MGSPFAIAIDAPDECTCDDCGCFTEGADWIAVAVDGVNVNGCVGGSCELVLDLAPGAHELTATARYTYHDSVATIEVIVVGDGGTSEVQTSGPSAGDTRSADEKHPRQEFRPTQRPARLALRR